MSRPLIRRTAAIALAAALALPTLGAAVPPGPEALRRPGALERLWSWAGRVLEVSRLLAAAETVDEEGGLDPVSPSDTGDKGYSIDPNG